MTSILVTESLVKSYGRRRVVDGVNLDVQEGDVFGFLGPNGAGKSTTIRMMLDLVRPTAGSITVFGRSLARDRRAVLSQVGALVERPDFYLYLDALTNLRLLLRQAGLPDRGRARELLHLVGLGDRGHDKVKTYSHGMRQRLGIAQTLLGQPRLIILDEPTTGLDPRGMKEVRELLLHLARDQGITVFLSTHLLAEVEQICSRVAIIQRGRLVAQGSVTDLVRGENDTVDVTPAPLTDADRAGADLLARAVAAAEAFPGTRAAAVHEDRVRVTLVRGAQAALNAHLVRAGVGVAALVPVRSLEEYFLRVTGEQSAVEDS
jgi:ABC-2 type transport system ATP-binding protein